MSVAVIIPTANTRPAELERAVRSVIPQAKAIVVNDGLGPLQSLDGIALLGATVVNTNGAEGPSAARNRGFAAIGGDIEAVSYLDDDDELLPNHVADLTAGLGTASYAFGRAVFRYSNGQETDDPEPANKGITKPKRYYDPSVLLTQNIAPVSSFMHTVAAFREIGGWDESLLRMEDWDFWARMFIRFGPPNKIMAATSIIHKGEENRSDYNKYAYSMSCSWRDVVADRLRCLSLQKRAKVEEGDLRKFHVPRIGVVLPAWNAEKYLPEALDSLRRQTYPDWEALVVDDGSTDGTGALARAYATKDRRIRVFPLSSNRGVSKALNYGLLVSRSEFVARMDADDVCEPERFAEQVAFLDSHKDIVLCGTWFWSMDEDLKNVKWENRTPVAPEDVKRDLLKSCCMGHPTVMMRRRVVETIGAYNEAPDRESVEDYDLWVRASKRFKLANIPRFLLKYREHPGQVCSVKKALQQKNVSLLKASLP